MADVASLEHTLAACQRLIALVEQSLVLERQAGAPEGETIQVPLVRYALAQLRQRIAPALMPEWLANDPVHVVMFGGTNSGKSTVLNVLLGRPAAGMSYRARFSQHPVAFCPPGFNDRFLDLYPTRFASYQRYVNQYPPRRSDADLRNLGYEYALAVQDPARASEPLAPPASTEAVCWDVPDFSTEEAMTYMPAVLDVVGLADLVVMTVTKENYADYRGGLLRAMIASSGVPMRVVANKLEDGSRLLEDIQTKLGAAGDDTRGVPADRLHPLPHVSAADEMARLRELLRTGEADGLRRAVAADVAGDGELKRRALASAVAFVERRLERILAPLRAEVAVAQRWRELIDRTTQQEFYERYRRDYLDGERYVDFNQTLVKLLDLLEVPGIGPVISAISRGLKAISATIVGSARHAIRSFFNGKAEPVLEAPEKDVVVAAFDRWLETLRNEAQVLAERREHPAWAGIAQQLANYTFITNFTQDLGRSYVKYRERMDAITDRAAKELYEKMRERPKLLHALRGMKLALDAGTTGLIVASHGLNWTDAVIAPLVIPLQRLILEYGLERYLDAQKARLKQEQFDALRAVIEAKMVAPVREMFRGQVAPEQMEQARRDFEMVKAAARKVAEG